MAFNRLSLGCKFFIFIFIITIIIISILYIIELYKSLLDVNNQIKYKPRHIVKVQGIPGFDTGCPISYYIYYSDGTREHTTILPIDWVFRVDW